MGKYLFLILALAAGYLRAQAPSAAGLGLFEGQSDVGTVLHPGSGTFDPATRMYTLEGSGEDMWSGSDEFHFLWKQVTGDVSLAATMELLGSGGENHRKAVLMVRQSLDPDSPYADAALHGDGLTSLQFRDAKGAPTHEIEANVSGPKRMRLEKHGDLFYLFVAAAGPDTPLSFAGGSMKIVLTPPFYVGIGVCAHNKDNLQQAAFSDVELRAGTLPPLGHFSTVETVSVASTDARVAYVTPDQLDSPNWSQDGAGILFNCAGKVRQIPAGGGSPQPVEGELPENYGQERSPDGRYIYLSSTSSGSAQIWRTAPDGSSKEQLTHDNENNAYPHLSPDGQQIAFISYPSKYMVMPANSEVSLRVFSIADRRIRTIAKFTAGPASFSAHPWSPDSQRLTFLSYQ